MLFRSLDEQGRIHHVGALSALEDQCSTWVPGGRSPDRLDARVWALSVLMLEDAPIDRSAVRSLAAAARGLARPRA